METLKNILSRANLDSSVTLKDITLDVYSYNSRDRRLFGAKLFLLSNTNGMSVLLSNYGSRVISIILSDKNQMHRDISLGYDTLEEYLSGETYMGSIIGRCSNRIANGKFSLDGLTYNLDINNNPNNLHGGSDGYDKRMFFHKKREDTSVELCYISKDFDQGFPGQVLISNIFTLSSDGELTIEFKATSNKRTVINLTNHAFFNLGGFNNNRENSILSHIVNINASRYTPVNENLIPTGELSSVLDTPFDFTISKSIAEGFKSDPKHQQLDYGKGYDHNYVVDGANGIDTLFVASAYEPSTGIQLSLFSNQEGMQFYTGNWLHENIIGRWNTPFNTRSAFCFEPQKFPNSINDPKFPSPIINKDEEYYHKSIYKIEVTSKK